jgi:hypothetical protein
MKIAHCKLSSISPYSQSRAHQSEKLNREGPDDYEQRTWREKSHYDSAGVIFIPPMSFKQSVDVAAKMLGRTIPGKGKATYSKFFLSGVLVMEGPSLGVKKDEVAMDRIHANADGVRGSGKRVWRNFPRVDQWSANVDFHILADEITQDVFEETLTQAGQFVGIGRFRPQNGGFYGRFKVDGIEWN